MSNIAELLQQIITARYGRDVRQSIHDAIEICYSDGKSGATDLTARQLINDVKGDVDNLKDDFDGLEDELTALINAKTVIFDASSTTTIQNVLDAFRGGAICLMKAGEGLFLLSSVNESEATFYRVQSGENLLTVVETYTRTTADYYWIYHREEIQKKMTGGTGVTIQNNEVSIGLNITKYVVQRDETIGLPEYSKVCIVFVGRSTAGIWIGANNGVLPIVNSDLIEIAYMANPRRLSVKNLTNTCEVVCLYE